jgi:hypothetical protein
MKKQIDKALDMPLSVALIRLFSILMIFIGVAEFIVSGMLLDESRGENIGGIYYAATALVSGLWGLFMNEGQIQFNMLSLFLFSNLICSIVSIVYAGTALYIVQRISACAEFDPEELSQPRCEEKGQSGSISSFANFTCSGEEQFFVKAAQCATRYINNGVDPDYNCACTYRDGGQHCRNFPGYESCSRMEEILPTLSQGTYVLGYSSIALTFILLFCSCISSCTHVKKRGIFNLTAEEMQHQHHQIATSGRGGGGRGGGSHLVGTGVRGRIRNTMMTFAMPVRSFSSRLSTAGGSGGGAGGGGRQAIAARAVPISVVAAPHRQHNLSGEDDAAVAIASAELVPLRSAG